jgi:hypothetical protein
VPPTIQGCTNKLELFAELLPFVDNVLPGKITVDDNGHLVGRVGPINGTGGLNDVDQDCPLHMLAVETHFSRQGHGLPAERFNASFAHLFLPPVVAY